MFQYSVAQWLFIFYFYCLFGWCFESTYVSIREKRLVNRGFMRGPFLPLYGSGAVMMLLVSSPFQGMDFPWNVIWTYLAGCVGATALEYVTGVVMEAIFKVRYWDYSKEPFNFQGYICLTSTLAWGLLTVIMTSWVHRPVEHMTLMIPGAVLSGVTFVLTACIGADFALSFKAAMDLRDILVKLEQIREDAAHVQKRVDMIIALTNEDLAKRKEELSELREKYRMYRADKERLQGIRDFFQRGILRSHPSMMSRKFGESLRELQERLEQETTERRGRK